MQDPAAEAASSSSSDEEPGSLAAVSPSPSRPVSPGHAPHVIFYYSSDRARDEAETRRRVAHDLCLKCNTDLPAQRTGGGDAHPRATCPFHRSPTGAPRCHPYPI